MHCIAALLKTAAGFLFAWPVNALLPETVDPIDRSKCRLLLYNMNPARTFGRFRSAEKFFSIRLTITGSTKASLLRRSYLRADLDSAWVTSKSETMVNPSKRKLPGGIFFLYYSSS